MIASRFATTANQPRLLVGPVTGLFGRTLPITVSNRTSVSVWLGATSTVGVSTGYELSSAAAVGSVLDLTLFENDSLFVLSTVAGIIDLIRGG